MSDAAQPDRGAHPDPVRPELRALTAAPGDALPPQAEPLPHDLAEALRESARRLAAAGVASPRVDATLLAAHAAGVDVGEVQRRALLGAPTPADLAGLVARRQLRLPLQHLTGVAAFRRLELAVGPGVFVPRPETEVLVGLAVAALVGPPDVERAGGPVVVDLCSGSAAIALALADEVPEATVVAVELDPVAHGWARRNVARLGLGVDLRLGDAAQAGPELVGAVDVVTCNPPYIPIGAVPRDVEVREHDPELALYGGDDSGLLVPRRMIARAAALLRPGGWLFLEHADVQGEGLVAEVGSDPAWGDVHDERDLAGRDRVLVARRA